MNATKGIVRVDVILSIALFIILFGVMMIYVRNSLSVARSGMERMEERLLMLDNMIHGAAGLDATAEARLFFINSSTGYVNVSIRPEISFNRNATRAYLLPDWNETQVWVLEESPMLRLVVNATSTSYVVVVSGKQAVQKYQNPPASTANDSTVIHISKAMLMDTEKLENLSGNISYIRKNVAPFRIEARKDNVLVSKAGYNISSFQDIYSLSYPWLCINGTADVYACNITVMVW